VDDLDPRGPQDIDLEALDMNLTATEPTAATYITAWPQSARPMTSNLNVSPGETRPSLVSTPIGADGAVRLYDYAGTTHLVANIRGCFH
jgi:hypothetical protein